MKYRSEQNSLKNKWLQHQCVKCTKTRQVCCNIPSWWIPPWNLPHIFQRIFLLRKRPLPAYFLQIFPQDIFPLDIWSNIVATLSDVLEPMSKIVKYRTDTGKHFCMHFMKSDYAKERNVIWWSGQEVNLVLSTAGANWVKTCDRELTPATNVLLLETLRIRS